MKIIIFGASGGIGSAAVDYALQIGYEVVAVVRRNNTSLPTNNPLLKVVVSEIAHKEVIENVMRGCDAIIDCIGVSMRPFSKDEAAVEATRQVISYAKECDVHRFIAWATPSVKSPEDSKSYITMLPGIMASLFLPKAKKTLIEICDAIVSSGLDWTIVRFMAPQNSPGGDTIKISFGKDKLSFNIARKDIAKFMVDQVQDKEYIKRMPIIGT